MLNGLFVIVSYQKKFHVVFKQKVRCTKFHVNLLEIKLSVDTMEGKLYFSFFQYALKMYRLCRQIK